METKRILLRPWQDSDAETLFKYASDPDVGPRAGWPPHKSVEESLEIIHTVFNKDTTTWAIVLKETGQPMEQREQSDACIDSAESRERKTEGHVIGAMGYGASCDCKLPTRDGEPIVGYWVAKPYWNKGYCTEALQLMLDYIRNNTSLTSLLCGHFVDNPASGRVMEKCGFVPTGEECYDETLYTGKGRPIRVLRLEIKR
ncbi:MAG: GNAT family N-acetyltransferase [Prevotella sp.]|nr:GNAT family N-acetyltransferase [Prevotella sp.]